MEKDMKPKGENARHNLLEIVREKGETERIIEFLKDARKIVVDIIKKGPKKLGELIENEGKQRKRRSMIHKIPDRLEFISGYLRFYIDFTVVASEADDGVITKGSIVYGTNRTLCFADDTDNKGDHGQTDTTGSNNKRDLCKKCQLIRRCDKLEDKPLIQLSVNKHGLIKSDGKLEGEWWIGKDGETDDEAREKHVAELHFRTLNHIWKDALDWTNENILPQ